MTTRVAAVDLGASSVRVAVVDLDRSPARVEVVHRRRHRPTRRSDGTLRWNLKEILSAIGRGIELALSQGPLASIGVDTWGVDYGLLDREGRPVGDPICYRDPRTSSWRRTVDRVGARRLYELAGLQLESFNTIFQLAAHDRAELALGSRLLMMPELVMNLLVGEMDPVVGRTPAGTTGLIDISSGDWCRELIEVTGISPGLLPPVVDEPRPAGHHRGTLVQVIAGHDTACAFAAAPVTDAGSVVISSGTWMLVGMVVPRPCTGEAAFSANLSNEPAFPGGFRLLRNVTGMWMLDRCLEVWGVDLETAVAMTEPSLEGPVLDATDERFLAPANMPVAVAEAAGLPDPADVGAVVGCVLRSLATTASDVINDLRSVTGREPREIVVVGGGGRIGVLNDLIAEATGLSVRVGPVEATALGNALAQGLGLGRFGSFAEAVRWVG